MADDLLGRLAEDPRRAAVLLDVDGTLAPDRRAARGRARPRRDPGGARAARGRYALVACVSGRPGAEVERMLVRPGSRDRRRARARARAGGGAVGGDRRGVRTRRRLARRAEAAQRLVPLPARRRRGGRARLPRPGSPRPRSAEGLVPRWGRMVLEVRPPVAADKGTAVRALVTRAGVDARALRRRRHDRPRRLRRACDGLELAVRVAVDSGEAPAGARRGRRPRRRRA